jgi:nitrogen fixation protein NifU and related proteins
MNDFQLQILEHYKNPKNAGAPTWSPTHSAKLANLSCGDEVEVFLLIEDSIIKDFRFVGQGCSISIAAISLLSEKIIGMKITEFSEFNLDNLLEILGIPLSTSRLKCADLGLQATKNAISENKD